MTAWALRRRDDTVLDPSFGGCAFLAAARDRLALLGASKPPSQIYGIDVDPEAKQYLQETLGVHALSANFRTGDYLRLRVSDFGSRVNAIVGNPPYVRHHSLTPDQLSMARVAIGDAQRMLSGRAGYWAYFLLHAFTFLQTGGRLAMILPIALLDADYARPIRSELVSNFRHVRIGVLRERIFDADESAVVVLADGWRDGPGKCAVTFLRSVGELEDWCSNAKEPVCGANVLTAREWRRAFLTEAQRLAFDRATNAPSVTSLGKLARIRIGTVTGANHFFVINEEKLNRARLPESVLEWIVESAKQCPGLHLQQKDLEAAFKKGDRVRLFLPPIEMQSKRAKDYIEAAEGYDASQSSHCRNRYPWYVITDALVPDAFFTYVNHKAPRVIINTAGARTTNALHRLWWRRARSILDQRLIALSSASSLSLLSAELQGRTYGGGALKLEVGEASQVHVALPEKSRIGNLGKEFISASASLARGDWLEAREIADRAILSRGLRLTREEIRVLRDAQEALYLLRTE